MTREKDDDALPEVDVKTCPKCGLEAPVVPYFGYRTIKNVLVVQSYCKACRGKKSGEDSAA